MKRGRQPPPYRRARSAYRFLPAFFFPPLAFFAIVCYPPLHVGCLCESAASIARGCRLARSPTPALSHWLKLSQVELHKRWPELAALIPDVDYGRSQRSVKHNVQKKSKKCATCCMPRARFSIALSVIVGRTITCSYAAAVFRRDDRSRARSVCR